MRVCTCEYNTYTVCVVRIILYIIRVHILYTFKNILTIYVHIIIIIITIIYIYLLYIHPTRETVKCYYFYFHLHYLLLFYFFVLLLLFNTYILLLKNSAFQSRCVHTIICTYTFYT